MQCVEIGAAVDAQDHSFPVHHKSALPVLQRGLNNPRVALRPVVPAFGDQPHARAIALQPEAVAVVFYFMKPFGRRWHGGGAGRQAKLEFHGRKIGAGYWNCELLRARNLVF